MPTLQIFAVSTRPDRAGIHVAEWFDRFARDHSQFDVELIDLAEVNLPLFDEPRHPRFQQYEHEHTKAWSRTVQRADAFVFVTPEYNHSTPPSLVNALAFLVKEWAYKPVAFVSYGGVSGGTRAVNMIKQTVTALKMVPVYEAVNIPFFTQYIDSESGTFQPPDVQQEAAQVLLNELLKWTEALKPLRAQSGQTAPTS